MRLTIQVFLLVASTLALVSSSYAERVLFTTADWWPLPGDCTEPSPCKLIEAYIQANAGDTIQLSEGLYGTALTINKDNLKIVGPQPVAGCDLSQGYCSAGIAFLDGESTHRQITLKSGLNLTLERLALRNGNSSDGKGGAIKVEPGASLVLRNVRAENNVAQSGGAVGSTGMGGFIFAQDANIEMNQVYSFNNTANASLAPGSGFGGAVYLASLAPDRISKLTISDSKFFNNIANRTLPAVGAYTSAAPQNKAQGGVFYLNGQDGRLEVQSHNVEYSYNFARQYPSYGNANGGVLAAQQAGQAIIELSFDSDRFEHNRAGSCYFSALTNHIYGGSCLLNAYMAKEGLVDSQPSNSDIKFEQIAPKAEWFEVSSSDCPGASAEPLPACNAAGGVFYIDGKVPGMALQDTPFFPWNVNHPAQLSAPPIQLGIIDSELYANFGAFSSGPAHGWGGAIAANHAIVTVDRSKFEVSRALHTSFQMPNYGEGGAFYLRATDLQITNSLIARSAAISTYQDYSQSEFCVGNGDAIALADDVSANIVHATIANNVGEEFTAKHYANSTIPSATLISISELSQHVLNSIISGAPLLVGTSLSQTGGASGPSVEAQVLLTFQDVLFGEFGEIFRGMVLPSKYAEAPEIGYVSAMSEDYHLSMISPALDAAERELLAVDLEGKPRHLGAHDDLGCYETTPPARQGTPSTSTSKTSPTKPTGIAASTTTPMILNAGPVSMPPSAS